MLEHIRQKVKDEDASPFRQRIVERQRDGSVVVRSVVVPARKFWKDLEDSIDDEEDSGYEDTRGIYPYR